MRDADLHPVRLLILAMLVLMVYKQRIHYIVHQLLNFGDALGLISSMTVSIAIAIEGASPEDRAGGEDHGTGWGNIVGRVA